jgi:hypothetical protein
MAKPMDARQDEDEEKRNKENQCKGGWVFKEVD